MRLSGNLPIGNPGPAPLALAASCAPRFCCKLERQARRYSLAFNLHERAGLFANIGAAIAIARARVLDGNLALRILDHKAAAIRFLVTQLNELAARLHTYLTISAAVTVLDRPFAFRQAAKHSQAIALSGNRQRKAKHHHAKRGGDTYR